MNDSSKTPDLSVEEQEVLRELRASSAECPSTEDLIAYAEGKKEDAERDSMERHLLTCALCQELVERLSLQDLEVDDLRWKVVEGRLDARPRPWQGSDPGRLPRSSWAIAAAVLLILLLPALWMNRQPPAAPESTFRGSPIQQLEPSGSIRVLQFRWNAPPAALLYRVIVQDAAGNTVWRSESRSTVLREVDELMPLLEPGTVYRWKVQGLNEQQEILAESDWLTFSLAER